jgi:hypothetical protein
MPRRESPGRRPADFRLAKPAYSSPKAEGCAQELAANLGRG